MNEREQEALKMIKKHMWMSMGAGLIPILGLDLAAVSGVQLKMLAAISKIYGIPFQESLGKATIASLAGYVLPHAMSYSWMGSMLKLVPVVGVLAGAPAMALFAGAYTWALGKVFIQHFESGGTFLNFDTEKVKEHFRAQLEEGRKMAATAEMAEMAEQTKKEASVQV
jgi:uncharacterized protein (DUF697 family)